MQKVNIGGRIMTKKQANQFARWNIGRRVIVKTKKNAGIFSDRIKTKKLIRVCPGGRHAWYESAVGPIRRPYIVKK